MLKGVRCMVEECVFHEGTGCNAAEIEVLTNGNDIVGTPKGTMCGTFQFQSVRGPAAAKNSPSELRM